MPHYDQQAFPGVPSDCLNQEAAAYVRPHSGGFGFGPRLPGFPLLAWVLFLTLSLLLLSPLAALASADGRQAGEYQVKAAFILNFSNFVEWPEGHFHDGILTIGILGRDPFEGAMDDLKGKTVKGRKVVIRRYDDPEEALDADVLFIGASERMGLPRILHPLRGRPVLTVGDHPGFARSGVMINMVVLRKRVGFEINLQAARQSGLRISSQLLKLAKEVFEQ